MGERQTEDLVVACSNQAWGTSVLKNPVFLLYHFSALIKYQLPESEIDKIVKKLQTWGYSKFIKAKDNGQTVPGMDTSLLSLRIHTLTIEPGSFTDGKTIAELDLNTRYGITDYGLRRNNNTDITADTTTRLRAGDALILFTSDKTVQEIAGLFSHSHD